MTRLLLAVPLLVAAGCATRTTIEAPVRDIAWQAIGERPFWQVIIGDGQILFRQADQVWQVLPRTLPRTVNGVRTWRAGEPRSSITIEARRQPCTNERGQLFEESVRVRLTGTHMDLTTDQATPFEQTLSGCGGRLLGRARD